MDLLRDFEGTDESVYSLAILLLMHKPKAEVTLPLRLSFEEVEGRNTYSVLLNEKMPL